MTGAATRIAALLACHVIGCSRPAPPGPLGTAASASSAPAAVADTVTIGKGPRRPGHVLQTTTTMHMSMLGPGPRGITSFQMNSVNARRDTALEVVNGAVTRARVTYEERTLTRVEDGVATPLVPDVLAGRTFEVALVDGRVQVRAEEAPPTNEPLEDAVGKDYAGLGGNGLLYNLVAGKTFRIGAPAPEIAEGATKFYVQGGFGVGESRIAGVRARLSELVRGDAVFVVDLDIASGDTTTPVKMTIVHRVSDGQLRRTEVVVDVNSDETAPPEKQLKSSLRRTSVFTDVSAAP